MHRFYNPCQNISGNKIIIQDKGLLHHLKDVLRLKREDEVIIFDGQRNEYQCSIEKLTGKVILNIKQKRSFSEIREDIKITVAVALPKKSKMDGIVDKLTQLGADRIIPLETERVSVNLDDRKKKLRLQRWRRIALSASQQSQRNNLPIIDSIKDINDVLSNLQGFDLKLIPTLTGEREPLKEILDKSKPQNILVLIGPEGDFTLQEVIKAKRAGFIAVSLGDLVLRVETAAIVVAGFIRLYYEND
ncbi:MAG: 16S rRNA (uracil(1498)-N(3))-methyltransferase [Candidatus Omnitrophica bacterium]|nr:16S rRNA (uracil(1498)-N(3))-methyltransferase [Candidatus Omnitrophota bacterium]MBU4472647.1 16S rRNA (uracil(1498)-N(3))-methyltransferase [Candidatus Omnitrophota bacterium]MCG2706730.1 16S rRNA (uracil(1498)-N(3))-methyltransferase [Candidatus Omnitrophota bacterium]